MAAQLSTAAIAIFFKGYNSSRYTYNPTLAVDDEFRRLEQEEQWGPELVLEHRRLLDRAASLAHFFWKHEWGGYVFREDAEYDHEFWRLCQKKRWDEERIVRAVNEFIKISGGSFESLMAVRDTTPEETAPREEVETAPTEEAEAESEQVPGATPSEQEEDAETVHPEDPEAPEVQGAIARFFTFHNCPDYTYSGQPPRTEFLELIDVKKRVWRARDPRGTWRKDFRETEEFGTLNRDYHEAVEEHFDGLLDMRSGTIEGYRMKPWESMVELFRLGDVPISKSRASKLIKQIYVNIYDFLEFLEEPYDSPVAEGYATGDAEYERASMLRHSSRASLAQYSFDNDKVYPLEIAKGDGTLGLLLHPL